MSPSPIDEVHEQPAKEVFLVFDRTVRPRELDDAPALIIPALIADLHLWSDSLGVDWDGAIELANERYVAEPHDHDSSGIRRDRDDLPEGSMIDRLDDAELFGDLCDAVERVYLGLPDRRGEEEEYTSNCARAASMRILDLVMEATAHETIPMADAFELNTLREPTVSSEMSESSTPESDPLNAMRAGGAG